MQQDPVQILQKQHDPLAQEHYHLHFGTQFHPEKLHIDVGEDQLKEEIKLTETQATNNLVNMEILQTLINQGRHRYYYLE